MAFPSGCNTSGQIGTIGYTILFAESTGSTAPTGRLSIGQKPTSTMVTDFTLADLQVMHKELGRLLEFYGAVPK